MALTPITVTGSALEPGAPVAELDNADAPITLLQNWNPEAEK